MYVTLRFSVKSVTLFTVKIYRLFPDNKKPPGGRQKV